MTASRLSYVAGRSAFTALLVVVLAAGCVVEIDFSNTAFQCTDVCPDDYQCINNRCQPPGPASGDGGVGAIADAPAIPVDAGAPLTCAEGCELLDGEQLCLCTDVANWETSRQACADNGLVLARLGPDENAVAAAVIESRFPDTGFWLGGTDEVDEGQWRWLANDELFWQGLADGSAPVGVFTDFAEDEPNNFMGNEEDCLEIRVLGWNDGQCGFMRPYLCAAP